MSVIKSKEIYSIQNFFETFFGFCPITTGDEDELRKLMDNNGLENLWDYPLDEIEEIIENDIPVVLVDTSFINEKGEICREYRWVEIPDASSPDWTVEKHFISGRIDCICCNTYKDALMELKKLENKTIKNLAFLRIRKEKQPIKKQ